MLIEKEEGAILSASSFFIYFEIKLGVIMDKKAREKLANDFEKSVSKAQETGLINKENGIVFATGAAIGAITCKVGGWLWSRIRSQKEKNEEGLKQYREKQDLKNKQKGVSTPVNIPGYPGNN